jgi:hypothetical protein
MAGKLHIAMWIDIWGNTNEWDLHAPKDGVEPPEPEPLKRTKDWKRFQITIPVPIPDRASGDAKIHYEGIQMRKPS